MRINFEQELNKKGTLKQPGCQENNLHQFCLIIEYERSSEAAKLSGEQLVSILNNN